MSARLWWATLNPRSLHYREWREILGGDEVPLRSPVPITAELADEKDVRVYVLDIAALSPEQKERLTRAAMRRFDHDRAEVEAQLASIGFPIREEDCSVAFDLRAFA
jgi:hypothetical protein